MTRSKRLAIVVVFVASLAACAYGFLLYAGASMPYPDPTPALLQAQDRELDVALAIVAIGGLVALCSLAWLMWSRRR